MNDKALISAGPAWLNALRARGLAGFTASGLPDQRQEAWKYTGLGVLKDFGFEPSFVGGALPTVPAPLLADAHRLVFVDGRFAPSLSQIGSLPEGVVLAGLADLLQRDASVIEPRIGKLAETDRRSMVALNTAWVDDGLVLIVPAGVAVDTPIEVTHLATGGTAHPRLLVEIGANASATLVERHLSGSAGGFANVVGEIAVGAGAVFRHYAIHAEPETAIALSTLAVEITRDATYRSFALTAGGGLVRHETEVGLAGPGAICHLDGAYLVGDDRHADTTALIDHRAPHCNSRQTQMGVVGGHGRAVFQGKVLVRPDAQKTDAHQLSRTMLLSPHAEIDVKPELEIHADDVKCSHGATSGRIDPEALFYLRARGVPESAARALLIQGFIDGAIDLIDVPSIRDAFKEAASAWLNDKANGL